jgi:hypothetical protein
MSQSQSQLAARLASDFGLPVIKLPNSDGLIFEQGEVVKIFIPRSKRILGCGPGDRRVIGDLVCVFADEMKAPTGRSKKFDYDRHICWFPDANFSSLTLHSALSSDPMDKLFQLGLAKLFGALPSDKSGWLREFGPDFLSESGLDRLSIVVQYLRAKLEGLGEPFIKRSLPAGVTIKITGA